MAQYIKLEYDRAPQSDIETSEDLAAMQDAFFEELHALWSTIPEEELRKLPHDGAEHHDQYIRAARHPDYGTQTDDSEIPGE